MERNYSLTLEEQDNLRIVDHLDMQKLPELLQQMLSLATTPEEKDILLMSTLAGAGAGAPYLFIDTDRQARSTTRTSNVSFSPPPLQAKASRTKRWKWYV